MDVTNRSADVCRQIAALASELVDQRIEEEGRRRLESLMESDSSARACFVDCIALHVLLEAMHEPALCDPPHVSATAMASLAISPGQCGLRPSGGQGPSGQAAAGHRMCARSFAKLAGWGVAASLLISGVFWLWTVQRQPPSTPAPFVGVLSRASGRRVGRFLGASYSSGAAQCRAATAARRGHGGSDTP